MIGYPLDSHVTYKPDGTPVWDRAISSAPYRKLIKCLFSDGVLPNPSTNLQVSAETGMQIKIFSGFAICNGCQKLQETDMALTVPVSSAVYDRIDTVVLRLNDNDDVRECEFYIISGEPALNPVRPILTRSDSIWEIGIADILIKANSTQISNAKITDTRYESGRCGIISSISMFDTTTIYKQIQTDLAEFRDVNETEFLEWFNNIKEKLEGDVAANLQIQIGTLGLLETEDKTDLVSAVNEVETTHQIKTYTEISQIGNFESTPTISEVFKVMPDYSVLSIKGGDIADSPIVNCIICISKTAVTELGRKMVGKAIAYGEDTTYEMSFVYVTGLMPSGLFNTDWKQSGADVLDTMEEIEANTDSGKAAGALAVKELSDSLGGYAFIHNPTVVAFVSDGSLYTDSDGNYVLAGSDTGSALLADTSTYTTAITEGNFYRVNGADSVIPFNIGVDMESAALLHSASSTTGNASTSYSKSYTYTQANVDENYKYVLVLASSTSSNSLAYGGCSLKLGAEVEQIFNLSYGTNSTTLQSYTIASITRLYLLKAPKSTVKIYSATIQGGSTIRVYGIK